MNDVNNKHKYLILDVETANSLDDPLTYDIGFAVVDNTGRIYESHSYIISDIFYDRKELMQSAYYGDKVPDYIREILAGEHTVATLYYVRQSLKSVCEEYGVKAICAYNALFDQNALNTTQRYLTHSKYRYFLPYGIPVWCIWHMACQVIGTQKLFIKYAIANGFVSDFGNLKTSAEIMYSYIINNPHYQENHTGLEDVKIEAAIFAHCIRQKKKMSRKIKRNCWQIPTQKMKALAI